MIVKYGSYGKSALYLTDATTAIKIAGTDNLVNITLTQEYITKVERGSGVQSTGVISLEILWPNV